MLLTKLIIIFIFSNYIQSIIPIYFILHLQGFVIPVNIRVTDANDNAPQFINAPYVLNISEVRRNIIKIISSEEIKITPNYS